MLLLCVADFCACLFQYGGYEDFLFGILLGENE